MSLNNLKVIVLFCPDLATNILSVLAYLYICVFNIAYGWKCHHFIGSNTLKTFSLAGQHIENISSSHGKGKKTKSEFESKVSAAEKEAEEQKSALNASENLKREVKREVSSTGIRSIHTRA